jgi:hypothetical protein
VTIRPVPGAWLVSGSMTAYTQSDAAQIARVALGLATSGFVRLIRPQLFVTDDRRPFVAQIDVRRF